MNVDFFSEYLLCIIIKFQFETIRKRSAERTPFHVNLSATINSFAWLLYGLASHEKYSIIQNGIVFSLNTIQLLLFAIFPTISKESINKTSLNLDVCNEITQKTANEYLYQSL